jgi:ADP-ribosylglycohydrolase
LSYRHTDKTTDTADLIAPSETGFRLERRYDVDYRDKFRGAMVGTGIGDALGRPAEGMYPQSIAMEWGYLEDYIPWDGWTSGPKGTLTDDTELALCIAQSLVETGEFDPGDLAERFRTWYPVGRGIGSATWAACDRLERGTPWFQSGSASAGNGAAMRAAPLGLAAPFDMDELRRISAWSTVITHASPTAVASTVVMAYSVAYLVHTAPGSLDLDQLLSGIDRSLERLDDPELPNRRRAGSTTLRQRIHDVFDMRDQSLEDIFAVTHNGAFVLEALPAAIAAFVVNTEDPQRVITEAVNGGFDADTVGAMAGALAGAYHGYSAFPGRLTDELEFVSGLTGLGDELAHRAGLGPSFESSGDPAHGEYAPVTIEGDRWTTRAHIEAAEQAPEIRHEIRLQPHPQGATRLATADRRW